MGLVLGSLGHWCCVGVGDVAASCLNFPLCLTPNVHF